MRPFGAANFTSFDGEGFYLPTISKLNIFIGKNNSGKSNVLRFLKTMSNLNLPRENPFGDRKLRHWDGTANPSIVLGISLEEFTRSTSRAIPNFDPERRCPFRYDIISKRFVLPAFYGTDEILLEAIHASIMPGLNDNNYPDKVTRHLQDRLNDILRHSFNNLFFIPQFREFRYEQSDRGIKNNNSINWDDPENAAGYKLADRLAYMKSPDVSHNQERVTFLGILAAVKDLLGLNDLEIDFDAAPGPRHNGVILVTQGLRRNLEDFGAGIHQLVMMCFSLMLKKGSVICIEEPESFLHPGLQRKFIEFLFKTNNTYFITTHSGVFLDAPKYGDTSIYHVSHDGRASHVMKIVGSTGAYHVLDDLQIRASDIMQANGVIWVEGPTDRTYLLSWLQLYKPDLQEGTHFSIMFYGGRLLGHLTFDPDHWERNVIPAMRMNRHAVVIMDSEKTKKGQHLKEARRKLKKKLEGELARSDSFLWVTQGRDIENYVSRRALESFCGEQWGSKYRISYDHFVKLDDMVRTGKTKRSKWPYSDSKVKWCKQIVEHVQADDIEVLDLKKRLGQLCAVIEKWNQ